MNGVMIPGVSAGSNRVGASEVCTPQIISPCGAAVAGPRTASMTDSPISSMAVKRKRLALPAPLAGLADRMSEVSVDKSAPIVVYCNEGTNRGPRGTALLNEAGYTQAVNLRTGIEGWRAANLPTAAIK